MKLKSSVRVGTLTVYGSPTCKWCQKQTRYLDRHAIDYSFVDCTSETCPDYVTRYPTLNHDGTILVGFTKL